MASGEPEDARLRSGFPAGTEDWGWYMGVKGVGSLYLVGASAEADQPGPEIEWAIQIHRHRSFKDKITGTNRMADDDPLSGMIESLLRAEAGTSGIEVDKKS
jgi:hypothetical protein